MKKNLQLALGLLFLFVMCFSFYKAVSEDHEKKNNSIKNELIDEVNKNLNYTKNQFLVQNPNS